MAKESLIIREKPELKEPRLIIGFDGWPNAAGASTSVVSYLIRKLKAKKFGRIEPWNFYVLTSSRPMTSIRDGVVKSFTPPRSDFYYWKNESGNDLIFLLAREPDLHWKEYAALVFKVLRNFGGKRVYSIGGVSDYVPHTRDVIVSAIVNHPRLREELEEYELEFITYKGQADIHTILNAVPDQDLEVISLWGRAPIYLPRNPQVDYALLKKLVPILGLGLDLEDIRKSSQDFGEKISERVHQISEIRDMVYRLEDAYDRRMKVGPTESEDLIKGIEEWLKGQRKQDET